VARGRLAAVAAMAVERRKSSLTWQGSRRDRSANEWAIAATGCHFGAAGALGVAGYGLGVVAVEQVVTCDDVVAARETLKDVSSLTPVLYSRVLSELVGGPVYLKAENLQRTGSFKVRGGYVRIARLADADRARGVVAASAGNHAQGVALAASMLGTRGRVVMPERAPLPKVQATRGYGAEVVLFGASVEDAMAEALRVAERTGAVFIHPYDHPDIVAGQGTLGFEIIEQCPQARTILVPVGGGGLAAGVAVAVKGLDPSVQVVGVRAGESAVRARTTLADGIAVARLGDIPSAILRELAVRVVEVTEPGLSRALLLCLERAKQVVEPAGAAAVAALLEHPGQFEPPVVAVLSGGNIDPLLLSKLLRHGLTVAGRYLAFRCRLPDQPGALAGLLADIAAREANVLEVSHERLAPGLFVDEVEVVLQVETRGPEHCEAVTSGLRAAGYAISFT
jgi:threonine dehydratase